jgi:hypothetical protein
LRAISFIGAASGMSGGARSAMDMRVGHSCLINLSVSGHGVDKFDKESVAVNEIPRVRAMQDAELHAGLWKSTRVSAPERPLGLSAAICYRPNNVARACLDFAWYMDSLGIYSASRTRDEEILEL